MVYDLYADVIFLNNFTMDFLLLTILRKIMKLKKRKGGIFLASFMGAGYALAITIFPLPGALIQIVTTYVLMSTALVRVAFSIESRRERVKVIMGLYLSAAVMAGFFQYADQLIDGIGWNRLPMLIYVLTAVGCFFLICFLWETVKITEQEQAHLYAVEVFYQGRSKQMTAWLDTGNRLTEPCSNRPVSVVSADSCRELFQTVAGVLYIPYQSVGKKDGVLPTVRVDRMEIEMKGRKVTVEQPFLAISKEALSPNNDYQMLLNEKIWS